MTPTKNSRFEDWEGNLFALVSMTQTHLQAPHFTVFLYQLWQLAGTKAPYVTSNVKCTGLSWLAVKVIESRCAATAYCWSHGRGQPRSEDNVQNISPTLCGCRYTYVLRPAVADLASVRRICGVAAPVLLAHPAVAYGFPVKCAHYVATRPMAYAPNCLRWQAGWEVGFCGGERIYPTLVGEAWMPNFSLHETFSRRCCSHIGAPQIEISRSTGEQFKVKLCWFRWRVDAVPRYIYIYIIYIYIYYYILVVWLLLVPAWVFVSNSDTAKFDIKMWK